VKDLYTGNIVRASTQSDWSEITGAASGNGVLSDDGRYVLFQTAANNIIPGDTSGGTDLFYKDLETGALTAVSVNANGQTDASTSANGAISGDGRYVAYASNRTNLVLGDTNGQYDTFVRDMWTNETTRVSSTTTGGQTLGGTSAFPALSGDGRTVTFSSLATNMGVPDTNGAYDIFTAANWKSPSSIAEMGGVNLRTTDTARAALDLMEDHRTRLSSFRGSVGAMMYRLQYAMKNLSTRSENYAAAESRIVDVDVAEESSTLLRNNIVQQSGAAILAQANQAPALALTLLK